MNSYKTLGIVLKGTNFGEADKILTVFTDRFGKVKVMAKGIRKIKSHLAGSLEPFMLVDLQLYEGKTFYTVTGAAIQKDFPLLHSDLDKTAHAFFVGELVDRFMQENQKTSEVFDIFSEVLESLEDSDRHLLIRAFELKIIEASGFKPELHFCVHCKEKITPADNFWDAVEGGILCKDCQSKFHHGKEISDELIKLLRFIIENDFSKIKQLKLSTNTEDEAERILSDYLKSILDRELKSAKFLRMI